MSLFRKSFIDTGPKRRSDGEQKQDGGQRPVKRRNTERFFNIVREPNGDLYSVVLVPEIFFSQKIDMVIKSQENKMEDEIHDDTPILVNQFEYFNWDNEANRNSFAIIDYHTAHSDEDYVLWASESSNDPNDAITKIYINRDMEPETPAAPGGLFKTNWNSGWGKPKDKKISREILMVPRTLFNKLDASSREKLALMFEKIWVITFLGCMIVEKTGGIVYHALMKHVYCSGIVN